MVEVVVVVQVLCDKICFVSFEFSHIAVQNVIYLVLCKLILFYLFKSIVYIVGRAVQLN